MKKKKISAFSAFLMTYVVLLVILILVGLMYIWRLLIDYEAAMPDVNIERYIPQFSRENISALLEKYPVTVNEYNSQEDVKNYFAKKLEGKEISYRKLTGKYTNKTPVYEILAGDEVIASASLTEIGKSKYNFSVWDMTDVNFNDYVTERKNCLIRIPSNASIFVNGNLIDEKYFVKEEEVELTGNIKDYVQTVPSYRIYEITDLIADPKIEVQGNAIESVDHPEYDLCYQYKEDDVLKLQVQDRILAMAHAYGTYIINRGSLENMKSFMIGKAREYVSDIPAVWAYLYGQEYSWTFTDEEISNFVRYSEDCFSCDVNFTLNVVYGGRSISYATHFKCMYVLQGNNWYLADFILESN